MLVEKRKEELEKLTEKKYETVETRRNASRLPTAKKTKDLGTRDPSVSRVPVCCPGIGMVAAICRCRCRCCQWLMLMLVVLNSHDVSHEMVLT
jgi:hypothetical protein